MSFSRLSILSKASARMLDLFGSLDKSRKRHQKPKNDWDKIKEDWEMVGRDLGTVMRNYGK